eukprot:gene12364-biopygen7934
MTTDWAQEKPGSRSFWGLPRRRPGLKAQWRSATAAAVSTHAASASRSRAAAPRGHSGPAGTMELGAAPPLQAGWVNRASLERLGPALFQRGAGPCPGPPKAGVWAGPPKAGVWAWVWSSTSVEQIETRSFQRGSGSHPGAGALCKYRGEGSPSK